MSDTTPTLSAPKQRIGNISNYYGALWVKIEAGTCYWGIDDYDGDIGWKEIPESLYRAPTEYEANR